jgi:opacity protein-like surface antigen
MEYDYLGFGSETLNLPTAGFSTYNSNASLNVQEVKAGINFRFGP